VSGGIDTEDMIRFCDRVERYDLAWIEEPADPFDERALLEISRRTRIPIAVGERLYTRHGFRRVLEPCAVAILQPDVGNTGGFAEAREIAAMGEARQVRVSPHNCGSMLSTAASVQLAACIPNFTTLEIYPYFPERPGYVQVLERSPEEEIRDGFIDVPADAGLGVALARERLKDYLFASCGN
jgi:galactonate dehydratase